MQVIIDDISVMTLLCYTGSLSLDEMFRNHKDLIFINYVFALLPENVDFHLHPDHRRH